MAFASIHIPDFWVQAVARFEPALRDRSVALLDGIPSLSKVVAANQAALQGWDPSGHGQVSGGEI